MHLYFKFLPLLLVLTSALPAMGGPVQKIDESHLSLSQVVGLPKAQLKDFLAVEAWKGSAPSEHPWREAKLSDPRAHNPQNFTYVVTGLRSIPDRAELLTERPFASASLISNAVVRTYARFGFILDVTAENVIATFVTDGGTNRVQPWGYRQSHGVLSPAVLLNRTGWWYALTGKLMFTSIYNEVLLDLGFGGSSVKTRVRVIGLYLIEPEDPQNPVDQDAVAMGWEGPALSSNDLLKVDALVRASGLPLVRIKKDMRSIFFDRDQQL